VADRAEPIGYAAAVERVRLVIAYYSRAIHQERSSTSPDPARLEELTSHRRACVADRQALDDADEEVIARTAEEYGARYLRLTSAEPGRS